MRRYIVTYQVSCSYNIYDLKEQRVVRNFWRRRDARRVARYMNKTGASS